MKKQEMKEIIETNVLEYARYTITDRAIPNLSDGLKNIHRRIIWSMYNDKLTHDKKRTKSVNAVGSVLRYSPHGDASVYDACVRLANDSVNYQLIDGKGAFSSKTSRDVSAGASRYTEMRLAAITQELLRDINKNSVDMVNNYDDTRLEPTELPSTFPIILANPNVGIAVGIASSICSFNLDDIIDNTINIIQENPTFGMYPDFLTGGNVIRDEAVVKSVKSKGVGSFTLQAKWHVEGKFIYITEIPYTTTREAIIESVISLAKNEKVKGIIDINDNTGVNGMEIEIEVGKNVDVEHLMGTLFLHTPLQSRFNCNFTVLHNNKPVTMGTDDIIRNWLSFRMETLKRIKRFDLEKKQGTLHLLKGLQTVLLDIDKTVEIIRRTKKDSEVIANLMSSFDIDEKQATSISEIKLRSINEEYIINKIKDIKALEAEIEDLQSVLNDDNKVKNIIMNDLLRVRQAYSRERKTTVIDYQKVEVVSNEIEDYNLKMFITKDLYLKKIPLTSMRGQYNNRLKEDDHFTFEEEMTNLGEIIVFTDKHNVYKKRIHEIANTKPSDLGEYIPTLFDYEKDEKPLFSIPLRKEFNQVVVLGFSDGTVAKVESNAYYTKQNRQTLRNGYADKELIYVGLDSENAYLKGVTEDNYAVVRDMKQFNPKASRSTGGNRFLTLNDNVKVKAYSIASDSDIESFLLSSAGKGKKIK